VSPGGPRSPPAGGMACAKCFRTPVGEAAFLRSPSQCALQDGGIGAASLHWRTSDIMWRLPSRAARGVLLPLGNGAAYRLAVHGPAWSCSRPRLSLFPSTANTSKIGGEVVRPVSAARNGCATFPSLSPLRSAKARTACSVVSALQGSTILRSAERSPRRLRVSAVSKPAALSSRASGRSATMKRAPSASSTRVLARSFSPAMAASSFKLRSAGDVR